MTVLLVDDHPLFRSGLRLLLSDLDPSMVFVEADGVRAALAHRHEPVNLILLDLQAGRPAGLRALDAMREAFPDASIVALCSECSPALVDACLMAGACGFMPKAAPPAELIAALRRVAGRGICLPVALHDEPLPAGAALLDGVEAADLELLWMALLGRQPAAIRAACGLAEAQVQARLALLYQRLRADGRVQALWSMAQIGLCCPPLPEPLTVGA